MFRKVLVFVLFSSLILSGVFFSPVYKAEEDENFYVDQPYLQYHLHIHSLNFKQYDYNENNQATVTFLGENESEYPEMTASVYMRREYSVQESEDFRKLVIKGYSIYLLDKNYRDTIKEKLDAVANGSLDSESAITAISDITSSYDYQISLVMNQNIALEDLITLEMIKWIREEFQIASMIDGIPITPLDNRLQNVNETIKNNSDGNLSSSACISNIGEELDRDYYEEDPVDLTNQDGPIFTIDDVQAVWSGWHFESVGPSSSLLGSITGNNNDRLWIGQWMDVSFPNLTHTSGEHTVYFEWPDEDFSGKDTHFHIELGYGEIFTKVTTNNKNLNKDDFDSDWFSFSSDNGTVGSFNATFDQGYSDYQEYNWQEAVDYASTLTYEGTKGHLATITSEEEANLVFSLLDGQAYWLGGFHNMSSPDYTEPLGGWEWITGEEFNHSLWPQDESTKEIDDFAEPNEAGPEDCLEVWGFDKYLNDNRCHMGWMGFVVEYEMNGTNHYEAYIPHWEWDETNQIDIMTYVIAIPLTDEERNEILKEQGDPDADNDGIVDKFDNDDDNDGIEDEDDMDDDNDGIDDENDSCPGTPIGESIDEEGCSASQILKEISTEEGGIPNLSFIASIVVFLGLAIFCKRHV